MTPRIGLISVSLDLGAGRRGVDMGPSAIRIAGVRPELEALELVVREIGGITASAPELSTLGESATKYLEEVTDVCRRTRDLVRAAMDGGCLPLVLGGDHSLAAGSVAGVAAYYRDRAEKIGLLWVDAHADMNTPATTPSGNLHGMSLAVLLGRGAPPLTALTEQPAVSPEHVCVLGARSVDATEAPWVKESGIRVITMSELDERGVNVCVDEALDITTSGTAGVHMSFDLDAIDPQVAPGVGTPVRGGLTYREAHLICEKASRTQKLLAMDMVELNPVMDHENRTARLAVGLIASALGKTIL